MVSNLELSADGLDITITWTADERYSTEIQIKNGSGVWEVLGTVGPGVNNL